MNKAILIGCVALGVSCTYRMGRGLPTDPALAVGEIQVVTSIQGAESLIVDAFAREIARRSGPGDTKTIHLELLFLEDRPTASDGRQNRLRMALALVSEPGKRVEVAGTRVYAGATDALVNANRREEALRNLASELTQEGLPQLLTTPKDM